MPVALTSTAMAAFHPKVMAMNAESQPQAAAPPPSTSASTIAAPVVPKPNPSVTAPAPAEPAASELAAAPAEIVIDGRAYRLETYLWRDYMPMAPADGSELMVSVKLVSKDRARVAPGIELERAWITKPGGEVWASAFTAEERPDYPGAKERMLRGGPKWGPKIDVDVVVRVRSGGKTALLRAAKQHIERTG